MNSSLSMIKQRMLCFNAGVELLSEVGVYHMQTQRVLKFSKEEILEVAAAYKAKPSTATFGKGADEMVITYRTCDDKSRLFFTAALRPWRSRNGSAPMCSHSPRKKQSPAWGFFPAWPNWTALNARRAH